MTLSRTRRLTALVLTMAFAAVCLAACGSSSGSSSTSSASAAASGSSTTSSSGSGAASAATRSKFASCLKAHGVTLPARPAGGYRPPSGSGSSTTPHRFFGGGGGGAFSNPKFRAALQACGGGRGFAGAGARHFTLNHAAVTKFAACVKQHGYTLPAPNFSGKGPVFPASIESNKKFQAAAKPCESELRPAGAPSGGAPGGSSSSSSSSSSA